jgi:hypothetical protein
MAITPDTKDWAWVLQRSCAECGFNAQGFPVEAVPGMIMANAAAWQPALEGDARTRPEPDRWSPLEYGCHEQDPAEVAAALRQAAFAIAGRFENVTGEAWQRTGTRGDGARFTVETFARYLVHDPVHHLYDVTGQRAVQT